MSLAGAGRLATVAGLVHEGPGGASGELVEALTQLFAEVAIAGPGFPALRAGIERCRAERVLVVGANAPVEPVVWLALVAAPPTQVVVPAEPDPESILLLVDRRAAPALPTAPGAEAPTTLESLLTTLTLGRVSTRPFRVRIPSV